MVHTCIYIHMHMHTNKKPKLSAATYVVTLPDEAPGFLCPTQVQGVCMGDYSDPQDNWLAVHILEGYPKSYLPLINPQLLPCRYPLMLQLGGLLSQFTPGSNLTAWQCE